MTKDNKKNKRTSLEAGDEQKDTPETKTEFPGYPLYPPGDDIYSRFKEESDIDPENLQQHKTPNEAPGLPNEKDFMGNFSGSDLDVPGDEADEQQENAGSEDEENNYYSLGGDDHNDLEEDKGD